MRINVTGGTALTMIRIDSIGSHGGEPIQPHHP
ncbi:hypothetical protein Lcho_1139 [Leptothrix cholodnii SP-6]|uniref:Uncharacterized protein n=1 Tax=Leptothrix cholodnii (strain ATCC 51168 / LMG 8142 / SP-6) TaxID=395495 RepID=B1Y4G9_LEPCP|nr:hypothetical protein Lcho_1139 [Leptothrix cholodnii SP-6]